MPVLYITDEASGQTKEYNQSVSILRYLGRKFGYYPDDVEDAWLVDSAMDQTNDVLDTLKNIFWEQDQERKKKMGEGFLAGPFQIFLKGMAARIEKNATERNGQYKYLVGEKISSADIFFAALITQIVFNELNPDSIYKPSFE